MVKGRTAAPGPGQYPVSNHVKFAAQLPSWSMGTSKRGASAVKSNLTVPGPGSYEAKVKGSSPSYGLRGRDASQKVRYVVPGPGQYSPNLKPIETAVTHSFTFSGRTGSSDSPNIEEGKKGNRRLLPGPGKYDLGTVFDKKHGIHFGTERRPELEQRSRQKIPGPGSYSTTNGSIVMGKSPLYGFGTSIRNPEKKKSKEVPGPGAYEPRQNVGKEGKKYSLSGRPKTYDKRRNMSPGPGAYDQKSSYVEEQPKHCK